MTDFIPAGRPQDEADPEPLLDSFLREALPEVKLALGDLIDRDNTRAIPDRYVRLLPQATLVVTLRPDAARAIASIAADLEAELTDAVMRHGSLYDREYRVRLKEAGRDGAPLFRVSAQPADAPEPEPIEPAPPTPPTPRREPPPAPPSPPGGHGAGTLLEGHAPERVDPDATRLEGLSLPSFPAARFVLVVEDEGGVETERFPLGEPVQTLGRATDNAALRSDLQLTGSPNVSRRQLALVWAGGEGEPGFDVYNLGLNAIHVGEREIPGANSGKGPLELDAMEEHSVRVAPGEPIRIGGHGPVVRIVEAGDGGEEEEDPDRTRFG